MKLTNRKPECFWPESGQTQSRRDGVCGERIKEGKNERGKEFGVFFHFWLLDLQIKSGNVTLPVHRGEKNNKSLKYPKCFSWRELIKMKSNIPYKNSSKIK